MQLSTIPSILTNFINFVNNFDDKVLTQNIYERLLNNVKCAQRSGKDYCKLNLPKDKKERLAYFRAIERFNQSGCYYAIVAHNKHVFLGIK